MHHWRATLTYDGTTFHGWQIQPGRPTVQGTLAQALQHLTGEEVLPQGSGRTDAGVHALAQVVSFSLAAPIPGDRLHHALNRVLPPSIRVLSVEDVPAEFHARHSALRKTYEYRILPRTGTVETICPPFLAPYVWTCPRLLDLGLLDQLADQVAGTHDFTSFAAVNPDQAQRAEPNPQPAANIRTIDVSRWFCEGGVLRYRVTGSGFLHHMVRNLVGTFVESVSGHLVTPIPDILAARNRSAAGPTAPARGLFLVEVEY